MEYVVAVGNVFDGVNLFGPFESNVAAIEYAESERFNEGWYIVPVYEPTYD
jgi:hypothetical protein